MLRKMDDLGRITVPKEMAREIGLEPGKPVRIDFDKDNKVVKLSKPDATPNASVAVSGILGFITEHNLYNTSEGNKLMEAISIIQKNK